MDARALRVEDYEESLATRVRTLQRMFPEVASEIAGADLAFQEDFFVRRTPRRAARRSTLAAKGMTRVPVDVRAATRVVEELEAASVSVLMHGKVPTGASMRRWLGELKAGRGMGREAWRDEHGAFYGPGAAGENVTSPQESLGSQTEGSDSGSYGGWDAVAAAAGAPAAPAPSYRGYDPTIASRDEQTGGARSRGGRGGAGRPGRLPRGLRRRGFGRGGGGARDKRGGRVPRVARVSSTGPIRKATLDTVHRMRADANAERTRTRQRARLCSARCARWPR